MSYLVLARKWRPQLFDDLIGQEHVSQTLKNAILADRVHHAFLFTGARGVGKTSAARIFAKALNCQDGPTTEPCGTCPSCVEIAAGQGIDVFEIDGASNTGVDDIRELRENIRYLPSKSRYKIFIIDEVHMLSINAFNALLKTLEEPPEHAKFIFATTEPHKIPVTILSRCQRFDFRKISTVQVADRLRYIVDQEKVEISDQGLAMIARSGGGSMRDAQSTLDQVIAFCGDQVSDADLQSLLGLVDRRLLLDTLEAVQERDARRVLSVIARVDEHGHSFRQFCRQVVELVRSMVVIKVVEQPGELLDAGETELQELKPLAQQVQLEDLQRMLTLLIKTEAELAQSNYPRLTMEMLLIRLAQMPPGQEVSVLIRKLELLEQRLAGTPLPPSPPAESPRPEPARAVSPPPPSGGGAQPKKVEAPPLEASADCDWAGLVDFVKSRRVRIGSFLEHGRLVSNQLPHLKVALPVSFYGLIDREMKEDIQQLATEFFSRPVKLDLVSLSDNQSAPPSLLEERKLQESDREKRLKSDAVEHPMVKAAIDIFEGEVDRVQPIDKGFV
ncbi:MAG: DNA polymerase III subunit gamma/tau [Desulfuromonas sp.]|nr:MAG: DNA polymerase III subunit gamma/tau [Desulfuromonas sp.]